MEGYIRYYFTQGPEHLWTLNFIYFFIQVYVGVNFTICVEVNVTPPIFMCWDLNQVPRAGTAASLPIKPPPQHH